MDPIRIYTGFDQREAIGWHVFLQSVIERTDSPVDIVPLTERLGRKLGISTDGTNAFSKIRFAVPYLCGFRGYALWCDAADMLALTDIAELWGMKPGHGEAVRVVKHDYQPKSKVKYVGTDLEAPNEPYERKNWSSLIYWDCNHFAHRKLEPEFIATQPGSYLHRFSWLKDEQIGELPEEWNWLDEYGDGPAKVMHHTTGIPGFTHYAEAPKADEWKKTMLDCLEGMQYEITLKASER